MKRRKSKTNNRKSAKKQAIAGKLRQLCYPPEFRIPEVPEETFPEERIDEFRDQEAAQAQSPAVRHAPAGHSSADTLPALLEIATCLWYLKTKHFGRKWNDQEAMDDDPKVRRSLGRMNKSQDKLRELGVEIEDPTGNRYPQGGEASMRPIDLLPTPGISFDVVSETMKPMIFWREKLVQRAEVFVSVPIALENPLATPGAPQDPTGAGLLGSGTGGGTLPEGVPDAATPLPAGAPAPEPLAANTNKETELSNQKTEK